jgi:hypothetical protein
MTPHARIDFVNIDRVRRKVSIGCFHFVPYSVLLILVTPCVLHNVHRSNAAPHSTLFMNECGVEQVLYSMLCVGMCADLPNERASLLRLLCDAHGGTRFRNPTHLQLGCMSVVLRFRMSSSPRASCTTQPISVPQRAHSHRITKCGRCGTLLSNACGATCLIALRRTRQPHIYIHCKSLFT